MAEQEQVRDNLYLKILEIGRDNLEMGLSFNELIDYLKKDGFILNECWERTLREWFYTSFFHEEAHCSKYGTNPYTDVTSLNEHLGCNFILKGESCMRLLQYYQVKSADKSSADAKTQALTARNIAVAALIVSALFGFPDALTYVGITMTKTYEQEQIDELKERVREQRQQTNQIFEALVARSKNYVPAPYPSQKDDKNPIDASKQQQKDVVK